MVDIKSNERMFLTIEIDQPGFQVGDLALKWSDNSIPLGYHPIPIISLHGGDGPRVLIIGGTHGDEFEGPTAIMRLMEKLKAQEIYGKILLIPVLNASAAKVSSRVSPLDGQNLNRQFPGNPNGDPTAMLAHYIETKIIPRCDAVLDLHSGGKASIFAPCVLATRCEDLELQKKNFELAYAFGTPLIWALGIHNDNRSINSAAARSSVPMIAAELGGGGGNDPSLVDIAEAGILRCLRYLGIQKNAAQLDIERRIVEIKNPKHSLYAPADGLFERRVSAGAQVDSGTLAGVMHFPLEPRRPSESLYLPSSGFVLAHGNRGIVKRGDLLVLILQDAKDLLDFELK